MFIIFSHLKSFSFHIKELPAVRRKQPITKRPKFLQQHVQLLQWLHGKQQQHNLLFLIQILFLPAAGFGLATEYPQP